MVHSLSKGQLCKKLRDHCMIHNYVHENKVKEETLASQVEDGRNFQTPEATDYLSDSLS